MFPTVAHDTLYHHPCRYRRVGNDLSKVTQLVCGELPFEPWHKPRNKAKSPVCRGALNAGPCLQLPRVAAGSHTVPNSSPVQAPGSPSSRSSGHQGSRFPRTPGHSHVTHQVANRPGARSGSGSPPPVEGKGPGVAELGSETRKSSVGTEDSARGQSAAPETGSHSRAGAHAPPPCPRSVPPVRRACPGAHAGLLVVLPSVQRATFSGTPRMAPRAAQIPRAELCRTPGHARLRHRGPGGGAPRAVPAGGRESFQRAGSAALTWPKLR